MTASTRCRECGLRIVGTDPWDVAERLELHLRRCKRPSRRLVIA